MELIDNQCEKCLYFEGDLRTGNCRCTNGGLDKEMIEAFMQEPDWEEECEGFAPDKNNRLHHDE